MSFKQIKGEDAPIKILKSYLEGLRLQGGYLFVGPQGVGKKLAAITLAKAANCEEGVIDACDKCPSCLKIEKNEHPDIHILGLSDSEIKIEEIRQLQRQIYLRPYEARIKFFILDNAQRLTAEASNALLKILEEPPKNSVIILVSDKPSLLFKTIMSRCKAINFSALKRSELFAILKNDYSLDNDLAHFLAYFSEGRIGRALSLKDMDIMRLKNKIIDNFALANKSGYEGLILEDKGQMRNYINVLSTWFRDIYLIKIGLPHQEAINLDRREVLLREMSGFSFSRLNEILNTLSESVWYLENNINQRLLLNNLKAELWKG